MKLYAIRNKKTNRLLTVSPEYRGESDWGWDGYDEKMVDYNIKFLELADSEYGKTIFCTKDKEMVEALSEGGESNVNYEIKINFGWGSTLFTKDDLIIYKLGDVGP